MSAPATAPEAIDENLLHATVKLNTLLFAGVCGFLGGTTLLLATYASMLRGLPRPGHYLNLLGIFLPGYSVSVEGAWIGLFWGFVLGGVMGAVMYRVYARGIRSRVTDYLAGQGTRTDIERAIMRLDGHSLGLALGTIVALGLVVTTNWLVIRGTANESVHAALLAQYLPGYSVGTAGSLIGGAQVFVLAYAVCQLFAAIYNGVARWRRPKAAP
jgi:hypothetical protein